MFSNGITIHSSSTSSVSDMFSNGVVIHDSMISSSSTTTSSAKEIVVKATRRITTALTLLIIPVNSFDVFMTLQV